MQDFYRCEEGYEAQTNKQAHQTWYKLVNDMHYEARVQAVVVYCAEFEKRIVKKFCALIGRHVLPWIMSFLVALFLLTFHHCIFFQCIFVFRIIF